MRQLLTVILLLLTITFTNAQSQVKKDSISNTERLIDKYGSKVINGFDTIVKKATPVAEQGFSIAVKKNIAEGISKLLPIVLFVIFLILTIKEYRRIALLLESDKVPKHMKVNYGPFDEDNVSGILVIYMIITSILFIASLFFTISGVMHLIAPEWYAIEDIIELFK